MKKKMVQEKITVGNSGRIGSAGPIVNVGLEGSHQSRALTKAQLKFYRDRMVEPPLAVPPTSPEQATAALYSTKQRNISAMSIVVNYHAKIPRVRQITQSGEIVFQTTSGRYVDEIFKDAMEGKTNVGRMEGWADRTCDAYDVRDEFLKVTTERQALDFLREYGEFLPYDQQISWTDFKHWQRCAELVIERDILTTASKAILAGTPEKEIDPTGELTQLLRMLTGVYDHTHFGDRPTHTPSPHELEQLRRITEVMSETPRQAAERYQETLDTIRTEKEKARKQIGRASCRERV